MAERTVADLRNVFEDAVQTPRQAAAVLTNQALAAVLTPRQADRFVLTAGSEEGVEMLQNTPLEGVFDVEYHDGGGYGYGEYNPHEPPQNLLQNDNVQRGILAVITGFVTRNPLLTTAAATAATFGGVYLNQERVISDALPDLTEGRAWDPPEDWDILDIGISDNPSRTGSSLVPFEEGLGSIIRNITTVREPTPSIPLLAPRKRNEGTSDNPSRTVREPTPVATNNDFDISDDPVPMERPSLDEILTPLTYTWPQIDYKPQLNWPAEPNPYEIIPNITTVREPQKLLPKPPEQLLLPKPPEPEPTSAASWIKQYSTVVTVNTTLQSPEPEPVPPSLLNSTYATPKPVPANQTTPNRTTPTPSPSPFPTPTPTASPFPTPAPPPPPIPMQTPYHRLFESRTERSYYPGQGVDPPDGNDDFECCKNAANAAGIVTFLSSGILI